METSSCVKTSPQSYKSNNDLDSDQYAHNDYPKALKENSSVLSDNRPSATAIILKSSEHDKVIKACDTVIKFNNMNAELDNAQIDTEIENNLFCNSDEEFSCENVMLDFDALQNFKHPRWSHEINHPKAKCYINITDSTVKERTLLHNIAFAIKDACINGQKNDFMALINQFKLCLYSFGRNLDIHLTDTDNKTTCIELLELLLILQGNENFLDDIDIQPSRLTSKSLENNDVKTVITEACCNLTNSSFKFLPIEIQSETISLAIFSENEKIISALIDCSTYESLAVFEKYHKPA